MTIIRTATHDDIEAVAAMGRRFLQFAPQAKHLPLTDDQVAERSRWLVESAQVFLAEMNGRVVGMLACILIPAWLAPHATMAHELAWWVDEEARGSSASIRLVDAYETWARSNGATVIAMSDLEVNDRVGRMLTKFGYEKAERTYIKGA